MARMHHNISYSDTKAEKCDYKDIRRGASEDAFWDEDELVDHRRKGGTKKKRKRKGCPENNGKGHVYIWQEVSETYRSWWDNKIRTRQWKEKICCGCLHVNNRIYSWSRDYGSY